MLLSGLTFEPMKAAEQHQIVGSLLESVTVSTSGLDMQFHTDEIHSLITSLNNDIE